MSLASTLLLQERWEGIALAERTPYTSTLIFRSVSRGAGAIAALMCANHNSYPMRLFRGMSPELKSTIVDDPECIMDDYSKDFMRRFRNRLDCVEAQAELALLAMLLRCDILDIECLHAAMRRACLRSCQTWKRTFETVSADFWLADQRLHESGSTTHIVHTSSLNPNSTTFDPHSPNGLDLNFSHKAKSEDGDEISQN